MWLQIRRLPHGFDPESCFERSTPLWKRTQHLSLFDLATRGCAIGFSMLVLGPKSPQGRQPGYCLPIPLMDGNGRLA